MKHVVMHYIALVIILTVGACAFYLARPNITHQLLIGSITSVVYVIWGVSHHKSRGDLHAKIVIEYILIAAIAMVLLITIGGA